MSSDSGWQLTTLGQIAGRHGRGLVDGPFGSNLPASLYVSDGVPVLRGSNLSLGSERFIDDEFMYVSEETASRLGRSLCGPGDIIFTKKGTLGQTGLIPSRHRHSKFLLSSNQMKLSVERDIADPFFVYYYVSSPESRDKIARDAEATGVPKTNLAYLRVFPIRLPPLLEQRAIAHILGMLDDKIELNRRMNKTLEVMARAIFTSWFVDFDPVHAKAEGRQPPGMDAETAALFPDSFEDSNLGPIPRGWKVGELSDLAANIRDGIDPAQLPPNTRHMGLEHMPRKSIALSEWGEIGDVTSNKYRFAEGDILFGRLRPYFHKVGVAPIDGVCSTDILVVRPKQTGWFSFLLSHISSDELIQFVDGASTGTRMPRTKWNDLARYAVGVPDGSLARVFDITMSPMLKTIRLNIHQSNTLAAMRDALLPQLVSGQIRVHQAEMVAATVL